MTSTPAPLEAPWKAGLRGAKANLAPGLVLQAFALAVVLGYYFHPAARDLLDALSALRARLGVSFALLSTGLFGGLLPVLYLKAARATRRRYTAAQGAALTLFWAYKGVEIAAWYALLAWSVGTSTGPATIALKAFLDQFVYCPLFAIPTTAVAYHWIHAGFDARAVLADIRAPRWYARGVLPMLIANLGVWLPIVCIIYALPTPLQLPLQNIVLCFFTLMLAHMARRDTPRA